jgi:uncharacterized Zn finger protein
MSEVIEMTVVTHCDNCSEVENVKHGLLMQHRGQRTAYICSKCCNVPATRVVLRRARHPEDNDFIYEAYQPLPS